MDYIFPSGLEVKVTELEQAICFKGFKLLVSSSEFWDPNTLPCPFPHTLIQFYMKLVFSPSIISHMGRIYYLGQ